MSLNFALEHTTVTVNGHRVQGWADVADALQMPDIELIRHVIGPDGLMLASSTGMRGGPIIFKLLANAHSTAFFGRQIEEIKGGAQIEFSGTIANSQSGVSVRLERGLLQTGPLGHTFGNGPPPSRDFAFIFERIVVNYDGAMTAAPPPTPGA